MSELRFSFMLASFILFSCFQGGNRILVLWFLLPYFGGLGIENVYINIFDLWGFC